MDQSKRKYIKLKQNSYRMIRLTPKTKVKKTKSTEYIDIDEFNKKLYSGPVYKFKNEHKTTTTQ